MESVWKRKERGNEIIYATKNIKGKTQNAEDFDRGSIQKEMNFLVSFTAHSSKSFGNR